MCAYFKTETGNHSMGRSLNKKNMGIKKTEAFYAELDERVEAANFIYSATGKFVQYIYS